VCYALKYLKSALFHMPSLADLRKAFGPIVRATGLGSGLCFYTVERR
jgi:hypothetical protein